jgi:hypothetical protein
MAQTITQPRYLNATRMSRLAGVCRPVFTKAIRFGQVTPSAFEERPEGNRPLFLLEHLDRVRRELGN